MFAAADEEDFEDSEDSGIMASEEVKNKNDELKIATTQWKAQLKTIKELANNLFSEIKIAGSLPKSPAKNYFCNEGLTGNTPEFDNGKRIIDLAAQVQHESEFTSPLLESITQGKLALEQAQNLSQSLERHKLLEDEVKALRATIKAIESKRDELVESARQKISNDEARTVIIERLRQVLLDTYRSYLRADQRTCIKAIENLWSKYAVTAQTIEAERDAASEQLKAFLVELGYDVQDARVPRADGSAGAAE